MRRYLTIMAALFLAIQPVPSSGFSMVSGLGDKIVDFVYNTIDTVKYSAYKLGGTRFDTSKGVYVLDCSQYVGQILKNVCPTAFSNLASFSGSLSPSTVHYYNFFSKLSNHNPYWDKVNSVEKLRPGDIIVFRYKNHQRARTRGHVMVVVDKKHIKSNTYKITVADSAPFAHSNDTRSYRESGIGVGSLLLKTNPETGQPNAYAWRADSDSHWRKNVKFAMARPIEAARS